MRQAKGEVIGIVHGTAGEARATAGWARDALVAVGFLLFEAAQFFARPTLTELSPTQDVIVLAGQVATAALVLGLGAVWRRRGAGTSSGRARRDVMRLAIVTTLACVAGQLVIFTAPLAGGLMPAYAGSVLSGVGLAGCSLVWLALFLGVVDRGRACVFVVGALAASHALAFVVRLLGNEGVWLLFGFGCLDASIVVMLACVTAVAGGRREQRGQRAAGKGRGESGAPEVGHAGGLGAPACAPVTSGEGRVGRAYVSPLIGAALYALLFGLITQVHNNTQAPTIATDLTSSLLTVALLVVLLVRVVRGARPLRLETVFLVTVPVIAGVMALAALFQAGASGAADVLAKTFYNLYRAALFVFLLQRPTSDGAPLTLASLACAVLWGFTLVGSGVGFVLLTFAGLSATVVTAVLLGAMWLCMLASIALVKTGCPDPPAVSETSGEPQVVYVDRTTEQVRRLGEAVGLSEREREVVLLFVQGRSAARIAAELTLSENTVKTHLQNVYAKAGIHTKQELIDLVDAQKVG